ncbi:hypothetical protein DSO57_1010345 [Entomophthora muscae]|uniref:Uncharacterized protein n=1 Tax=Entomophthora muscae TaxID=34485 RepID=A0ACC2UFI6_9FUNG|nr:hypothetical protein DSO57_1010345 [Entomophthora muscae]
MSHFKAKSQVGTEQVLTPQDIDFGVGLLNYNPNSRLEDYHVIHHKTPSPHHELKLSTLDVSMAKNWMPFSYAFENINANPEFMNPILLMDSLSKTLDLMPAFSGRIEMEGGSPYDFFRPLGSMKLKLNNKGAWFCTEKLNFSFSEIRDKHFGKSIIPSECSFNTFMKAAILARDGLSDVPVLAIKALYFPCGSVILTAHISHLIADGRSMYEFIKLWSQVAMKRTTSPLNDCRHFGDAKELLSQEKSEQVKADFCAMSPYIPSSANVKPCCFSIHIDKLEKLKQQVNASFADGEWVSTNDIVCAMINRMVIRARKLDPDSYFSAGRTVDLRSRMGLESTAFGNYVGIHMGEKLQVRDVLNQTLAQTALTLRKFLNNYTPKKITQLIQNYSSVPPDAIPFQLAGTKCDVDFIVTSLVRFDPSQVNFDNSPGIFFSGSYYLEGGLSLNPIYRFHLSGVAVIADAHAEAFLNDSEAQEFGFLAEPMPFNLYSTN